MEKLKNRMKLMKNELTVTAGRLATGDAAVFTRREKIIVIAMSLFFAMLFIAVFSPSSALTGDIVDTAKEKAKTYYKSLFVIVPVIAGLFLLIAILWAMVSPTSQGARKPIEWGTRIVILLIAACSIGGIIALVNNLTNGLNFNP